MNTQTADLIPVKYLNEERLDNKALAGLRPDIKPLVCERLDIANDVLRENMQRRVVSDAKKYRWSVGYSKACGYYSAGFDAPKYLGSSLNRSYAKNKKESEEQKLHRKASYIVAVAAKRTSNSVESESEYENQIKAICDTINGRDIENKRKYSSGVRCKICRYGLRSGKCDSELPVHVLSSRSRVKIRDKATAFFRACPYKRCFVTLTFIGAIGDKAATVILNSFLTQLKKKFKDFQYLWVAERQNENQKFPGNIHFHIIVNRRLTIATYNRLWVLQQYNAGLTGSTKYGREVSIEEIRKRYKEKTVHEIFNPFDIKKVNSINALSSYLTKYIVKQDSNEAFACAAWHCSRGVSRLFTRAICSPAVFTSLKGKGNWMVNKETGEIFEPVVESGAFWVCIHVNNKNMVLPYLAEMEAVNKFSLNDYSIIGGWRDMPVIDEDGYRKYFLSEN